jgi:hypothetical protein
MSVNAKGGRLAAFVVSEIVFHPEFPDEKLLQFHIQLILDKLLTNLHQHQLGSARSHDGWAEFWGQFT